ncbi:MAG TPA: hypothetical protein PLS56_01470 [Candidatus Dojkabacteria bacterium]|nr:hypothetical protein [Candidatus Dojkabacteria bacterium]
MDFSLTRLFVVPVGNTVPTSGSTESLTDGQFGVVKDMNEVAATAGNIGTAQFIRFVQGRPSSRLGTKKSDRVKSTKVKKYYKVSGSATAANEIWDFSDFTGKCDQTLTLTLRGHSSLLDTISFNGFTRSISIQTPCCDCGADPCDAVSNETIIDLFLAKLAQIDAVQKEPNSLNLTTFWYFYKVGTGDTAKLRVESKPLAEYSKFCDIALNPYEYDRISFRGWVYANPDTSIDFLAYDRCEQAATATIVQRSSYVRGTSDQVYQEQLNYYSYQSDFKSLYRLSEYNQKFEDYVTDGTVYDLYVLQFDQLLQDNSYTANLPQDERVLIYVPQGAQSTALQTLLFAYLGSPTDETGAIITTTTTSTTTSTSSTSSTTTLIP